MLKAMIRRLICSLFLLLALGRGVAAQSPASGAVDGVVLDQTGGALPGASVDLVGDTGIVLRSTVTDPTGTFRFDGVPAGIYDLRASLEGFKQSTGHARVGPRRSSRLKIVLDLNDVKQELTVTNDDGATAPTSSTNQDAVSVDRTTLEGLPILDQDLVAGLSRFLDAGSLGSGGPTIVVNGMEVSALRVSASAVQQIKINQDPYAAEYSRPGRGRIEIITKPGGRTYEGEANVVFRDDGLDARNAFATKRPNVEKRIFEGVIGGPLGHTGRTSFMFSGSSATDDQQAEVFAIGPGGAIQDVVPQHNRDALVSFNVTHQLSDRSTISIRPSYKYELSENRGVGGITLASAGTTYLHHEQAVTYMQQSAWGSSLLNQFQILVGHERESTLSVSPARRIVVAGAFTSGGPGDLRLTETHAQMAENFVWIHGHHQMQAGFQLPDWSRRGFFDSTGFNGAYYFSDLAAYAAGRPYSFIAQTGNGDAVFLEKQVGAYVKDDWQIRQGLTASIGLRYDWQNYFHDSNNLAPRFSLAYAPGNKHKDVLRLGFGIFNDRSGAAAIADLLHSRPGGLVRYVISNPSYPDPFPAGSTTSLPPPGITRLSPTVQIPQSTQYSVGLDHELQKGLTVSMTYTGARGYNMFRSRDVNAPLPPLFDARPDPAYGAVREIDADGRQSTQSVQVTLRARRRWFNGQAQYTWSHARNDTSGIKSYPANDYDLSGEWSRADFDRRHRFLLLGTISAPHLVDLGVGVTMMSAAPYSETLGDDIYNNGRGGARPPGVSRNSLEGAGTALLDLRLSRTLKTSAPNNPHALTLILDAFNVLNRVNYDTFVGTVGSPLFLQPVTATAARRIQLSARVTF
jgi:hypothetical protein